jgi:hypothetical protein
MEHRQFRQCGNVCSLLCAWCECSNPSGVASCCRRLCCISLHSSTKSNQSRDGLARFQSILYSCSYVVLGRCGCCPLADCHLYLLAETVGFERVALRWRQSRVASDSDFDRRPRPPLRHRPPRPRLHRCVSGFASQLTGRAFHVILSTNGGPSCRTSPLMVATYSM